MDSEIQQACAYLSDPASLPFVIPLALLTGACFAGAAYFAWFFLSIVLRFEDLVAFSTTSSQSNTSSIDTSTPLVNQAPALLQVADNTALFAEIKNLHDGLERIERENQFLKQQYGEAVRKSDSLEQELNQMRTALQKEQAELEAENTRLQHLTAHAQKLENQLQGLVEDVEKLSQPSPTPSEDQSTNQVDKLKSILFAYHQSKK